MGKFREDYQHKPRAVTGNWKYKFTEKLSNLVYVFSNDDADGEYKKIKKEADGRVAKLFPPQGESSNAQQPGGLVRALFDDQIHDSRAWFMQATFDAREPWGSYFLYRMIYFGELVSKNITPLVRYRRLKDTLPGVDFIVERFERVETIFGENSPPEIKQKISVVNSSSDIPLTMSSPSACADKRTSRINRLAATIAGSGKTGWYESRNSLTVVIVNDSES